MRQGGRLERSARLKVHCLAAVFSTIGVIHGVLAAVDGVAWPVVLAAACVTGALALEWPLRARGRPRRDAAQRILREGLADLPYRILTHAGR